MRILIVEGAGVRPTAYASLLARTLGDFKFDATVRPFGAAGGAWGARRRALRAAQALRARLRPDVVHVLSSEESEAAAFLALGVPVVHTVDGSGSGAREVVASTQAAREEGGFGSSVPVLPYAMEIAEGNDAAGCFVRTFVDPGDDRARRWVEEAARRLDGIPIRGEGDVSDARLAVRVSSRGAGWPAGIAEAMVQARPVVATWNGASSELVVEGVTGFLCAPGDVASLAAQIAWLWGHAAEARRMGEAGREQARDQFDPFKHVRALLRHYLRAGSARIAVCL